MKATLKKVGNVMSWVTLIVMSILLVISVQGAIKARETGESNFLLGYRPVLVLTGSMEPYMMTNGIALTKEVTDISQLEVGDVVTYHMNTSKGRLVRITHRIIDMDMDNGFIYTKGDNNRVNDGYTLTIDNIEAKVVAVFNQSAWIAEKWQTTAGKVMIISFTAFIILSYSLIKGFVVSAVKRCFGVEDGTENSDHAEKSSEDAQDINKA